MRIKSILLFTIVHSLSAHAWELNHVNHPTKGIKNEHLRSAMGSVASMALEPGHFELTVDSEVLRKEIDVGEKKDKKMSLFQLLRPYLGVRFSFTIDGKTTLIFAYEMGVEVVTDAMIQHDLIKAEDLVWKPAEKRQERLDQPNFGTCSAFRVADDIFFTANHCLPSQFACNIMKVRFNEELDYTDPEAPASKKLKTYQCKKLLVSDRSLEFSAFQIDGVPDKAAHPPLPITLEEPKTGEEIYLVGQPGVFKSDILETYKQYAMAKVRESLVFDFPDAVLVTDWDKVFTDYHAVPRKNEEFIFKLPVLAVADDAGHGSSGGAALNELGEVVGTINLGVEWAEFEKKRHPPLGPELSKNSEEDKKNEPPKKGVNDTTFTVTARAIHTKHGAYLENLGVVFLSTK